jgi:GrpB-like predicted nucleotidyltransferase (UPF0157 family)
VAVGERHWQQYLGFRDALRVDAMLRDDYATLKLDLTAEYPRDREVYLAAKTSFVEAIVRAEGIELDQSSIDAPVTETSQS